MLKLENITMKFGNFTAVDDLSLDIKNGEILGLLGANGAGKTTTFRIILGILKQTYGKVFFDGKDISMIDTKKIGFLAEERALIKKYTVNNQLKFFAELKGVDIKDIDSKIDHWLNYFNLEDKKNSKIGELSKGNQQKIQFISAVIHEPKLIIFDEPFSGLDPFNINLFKKIILELKDKGACIIFSSHRLDHVEFFCENIVVLVNGKAKLRGIIHDLKKSSGLNKVKIIADIDIKELEKLEYVDKVIKSSEYIELYIRNNDDIKLLFNFIKNYDCIHFEQALPTLEEIFVEKVGVSYES
ncbi:MAG: ABC transporter ATP-binding protein [Bacilli bacterium]